MKNMQKEEIYIGGVKVNFDYSLDGVVELVKKITDLPDSFGHYICTTGPEFIMTAQKDSEFKAIINNSDLSLPDGYGVVLARKYLKNTEGHGRIFKFGYGCALGFYSFFSADKFSKEKITGVQLFNKLTSFACAAEWLKLTSFACAVERLKVIETFADSTFNIFLLGGRRKNIFGIHDNNVEVAKQLEISLKKMYPNIKIIGATSAFSWKEDDDTNTVDYIHHCMKKEGVDSIDILFVAYGHPNQEKWIVRNSKNIPAKISIGIGGVFDYLTGYVSECPSLIQHIGLEWLYRLVIQPWRIRRIITAFPIFPLFVYKKSIDNQNIL